MASAISLEYPQRVSFKTLDGKASFYAAYDAAFARPAGHALRRDLYDFYHLLNHVNLFGAGYLRRSERTLTRLLGVARTGRRR